MGNTIDVEAMFGENVFNDAVMREMISADAFKELQKVRRGEQELSLKTADIVADAMRRWAVEKGATHYCHWFQPLTGFTAEKHDAFISRPDADGKTVLKFSGKNLIKGEPDASSFPSGGLRATFEARGYTAWDCTSPAFVREDAGVVVLYIPTAFCSYTGESLDKKTPLLRSIKAVSEQALRLIRLFGNTTSKSIITSVGAEQEYFIVDRKQYLEREDLVFAGRTLFGANPPKGQEMDDHYMGTIPERVASYMMDVNEELWRLGVPAKTQHNEAAPAQHELAPIFEETNIATDHNQLVMETLKQVAEKHHLMCLLHEKPFKGVNGSGKHNNWSLNTDDGINLFDPGKNPHSNLQFFLILTCMMRAVDRHADLLIESIFNVGNESRLGGNEAPPTILSMFIGEQLEDVLNQLLSTGAATSSIQGGKLSTGVSSIPDVARDAADRNRTSPFAFTGNKFEFRSVGSMDSIAEPNVVLNTIAAEAFRDACDILEKAENFDEAVLQLIQEYGEEHKRIIFNGNNYTKEWEEEAERRGLPRISGVYEASQVLFKEETQKLYSDFGIYTKNELESRAEIQLETYAKARHIEARTMIDMAGRQYIPAVVQAIGRVAKTYSDVKEVMPGSVGKTVYAKMLQKMEKYLTDAYDALEVLKKEAKAASMQTVGMEQAKYYRDRVVPAMEALRQPIDKLERVVDKDLWPVPSYSDLMFEI